MSERRSMHDLMEDLRCAYEQGDGRDQAQARVALLAAWEDDLARLATLEARVAALVPLARRALADGDWPTDVTSAARAALAAIAAEQTTTTGGQDDGE